MKLRTKKTELWIDVERDGEIAKFLVSLLTPKESLEQLTKFTKTNFEKHNKTEKIDYWGFKLDTIDKTIINWEGVLDEDGNPMECNKKNKEVAYLYNASIIDEVLEKTASAMEAVVSEQENERKN